MRRLLFAVLLIALTGVLRADGVVTEVRSGDEFEGSLGVGGVDAFLIALVAGADLRVRMEAEEPDVGAPPTLVIRDPLGVPLRSVPGFDLDERLTVAGDGFHRVEVVAGTYVGEYSIEFDADFPDSRTETGVPAGQTVEVRVSAPLGANVEIRVRRVSGAPPEIVSVRDATGRALPVVIKRETRDRVRLVSLPVTAPGGLFVSVRGRNGGSGSYRVSGKTDDDGDDAPDDDEDDDREGRRIVVQLAAGADAQAVADALGYVLVRAYAGFAVLETPEGREGFEDDDARDAQQSSDDVVAAEANRNARIPEGSQSNPIVLGSDLGRTEFDDQPAFQTIRTQRAHERATGAGAVVAVVDTGIDATHSAFAGATILAGYDFVDDDPDPSEEANGTDDDDDGEIDEGFGHGTFIAGLILGVAPDAQILPLRVLDSDGRGSVSNIAAAIDFAVESGADVINLSLGMRNRSDVLGASVRFALANGVTVVAATGNAGDLVQVDFPGGIRDVNAVTAVDGSSRRPNFANAGGRTDIAAPGVDLVGPYPGEQWGTWSGTSFAAALASGTSALVEERRPGLTPHRVARRIRRRGSPLRDLPRAERRALGGKQLDAAKAAR